MNFVIIYAYDPKIPDKVLLIKKDSPDFMKGLLNFPGGKIDKNESALECAVRELKEETGLTALSASVAGKVISKEDLIYCVKIKVDSSQEINPDQDETEPVNWFDMKILDDNSLIPNLRVMIPLLRKDVSDWQLIDWSASWYGETHKVILILDEFSSLKITVRGII